MLIAAIAGRQHGVITTAQLAELGLTYSGISKRTAHGRLHRKHPGVYAVDQPRRSQHCEWMAAILACGTDSYLASPSAAVHMRLWRRRVLGIHVLTPHQLANVIHEAAFRKLFDPRAVRAAMNRANGRHDLHVLEQALELNQAGSAAGTRSDLEDRFLALTSKSGLPEPLVNTKVNDVEVARATRARTTHEITACEPPATTSSASSTAR